MGRRAAVFIVALTLGAFLAPLPAAAQAPGKVYRIGNLIQSSPTIAAPYLEAFKRGLREFGYVEGQNVVIERRWADNNVDKLPDLAAELVRLKVDVIVTVTVPVAEAAKKAASTIPIVMASGVDPIRGGVGTRELLDAGGLLSYGPNAADLYRLAAVYVIRADEVIQ